MQFDYSRIWPYVIAALAVLLVYRRLRRSFGRQRVRRVRMSVRIGILVLLGCSLLPMAFRSGQFLAAELTGLIAGFTLGIWGARRTRYQAYKGGLYYVPHSYTGVAVSLLLVGRLVYRLVEFYSLNHSNGLESASLQSVAPPAMMRSPLTVGLLIAVVGYYVCYYSCVMWKSKRISPEDLEVATSAPPNGVSASG